MAEKSYRRYGCVAGIALVLVAGLVGGAASLRAAEDTNPYIELYKLRIEQAEASLRRQNALVELANAKLARGRKLITQSAISREEFDTLVSDAAVAAADVELQAKKVEEAKTYLRIIEPLANKAGKIPLCTYEME